MARDMNTITKESEKLFAPQKTASIATQNKLYDSAAQSIKDTYTQEISDSEVEYEDAYRENAVQKKVNEYYIAEEMANMGLTNSGLNRTQQTSNQLSYANNKAELDRQRQSMVDGLTREMTQLLADNENSRLSAIQSVEDDYAQLISQHATSTYNSEVEADTARYQAELEAETKRQESYYNYLEKASEQAAKANENAAKAAKEASYIIKQDNATLSKSMQGSFSANGVSVKEKYEDGVLVGYTYVDNNSGKETFFDLGVNPFTGTTNKDIENVESDAFSNGYQPNNVNGNKLSKVNGAVIEVNGNKQSVWQENGNYYYWDGRKNKYIELTSGEKLELGITSRR